MKVFLRSMLCERSHVLMTIPHYARGNFTRAEIDRLLLQECREALGGEEPECEHCVSKVFAFESEKTSARSVAEIGAAFAVLRYTQELSDALRNVNDLYEAVETCLCAIRTDTPPSPRDRWIKSMMLLDLRKPDPLEVVIRHDFSVMSLACENHHAIYSVPLDHYPSNITDSSFLSPDSLSQELIERTRDGRPCDACESRTFRLDVHNVPAVSPEDLRMVLTRAIALNVGGTVYGLHRALDEAARTWKSPEPESN